MVQFLCVHVVTFDCENVQYRIKYRVENVCIKIWALKILSGLKQYEEIVIDIIHKNCKDLEDDYKGSYTSVFP